MNIANTGICLEYETVYSKMIFMAERESGERKKSFLFFQTFFFPKSENEFKLPTKASLNWSAVHHKENILFTRKQRLQSLLCGRLKYWQGKEKKAHREELQIMKMKLHLNSGHLSEARSVSHRSPKCFLSRPSNPTALGLGISRVPAGAAAGRSIWAARRLHLTLTLAPVLYQRCRNEYHTYYSHQIHSFWEFWCEETLAESSWQNTVLHDQNKIRLHLIHAGFIPDDVSIPGSSLQLVNSRWPRVNVVFCNQKRSLNQHLILFSP